MNSTQPKVSIILRTYNEERWISHCLEGIYSQNYNNLEVVLVDNNSTDHTLEIAKRYPLSAVINIENFFPGKALNDGIRASSGKYIICISAHCIPKDENWIQSLLINFDENEKLAGVYGRQLPLAFTSDADKRDLLIAFGQDKKVQKKDYFFHNANSMLPRSIWEKFPFDEKASNIEDRIWGKLVLEAGYTIIYEPTASVYHYHGLHQHESSSKRAKGIATILDKLDGDSIGDLPESLKPENIGIAPILLVNEDMDENSIEFQLLLNVVKELKLVWYVNEIYLASFNEDIAKLSGVKWINRNKKAFDGDNLNVESLLSICLSEIESNGFFPGVVLYVNHHYPFRPKNLFDTLVSELQYKGLSSVFPCFEDYGHYWQKDTSGIFFQIDSSMDSRINREPVMRALYGLGCATTSEEIRKGTITGNNVGIVSIDNFQYTLNSREIGSKAIIEQLFIY